MLKSLRPVLFVVFSAALLAQAPGPQAQLSRGLSPIFRFSPDGKWIVSTGASDLSILSVDSGRIARTIPTNCNISAGCLLSTIPISADGRWIATPGIGKIDIFNFPSGEFARSVRLQNPAPTAKQRNRAEDTAGRDWMMPLSFNADGSQINTVDGRGISVWSAAGGQLIRRVETGTLIGESMLSGLFGRQFMSEDGRLQVVVQQPDPPAGGNSLAEVGLWDISLGRRIGSWSAGNGIISRDGKRLALIELNQAGSVQSRIVEVATGKNISIVDGMVAAFTPDSKRVLATREFPRLDAVADGTTAANLSTPYFIHDLESRAEQPIGSLLLTAFSFSPDGEYLAFPQGPGAAIALVSLNGKPNRILDGTGVVTEQPGVENTIGLSASAAPYGMLSQANRSVAFSPDRRWLAMRNVDGQIDFFDLSTGARAPLRVATQADFVHGSGLAFTRQGRELVIVDVQESRLFEIATGKLSDSVSIPAAGRPIDIQDTYVAGGLPGNMGIWNLATGSFAPVEPDDVRRAWAKLADSDTSSIEPLLLNRIVFPIAVTPDGQRFAASEARADLKQGQTIGIYDTKTRRRLFTLDAQQQNDIPDWVNLAFSSDGRYIAAGIVSKSQPAPEQRNRLTFLGIGNTKPPQPAGPQTQIRVWNSTTGASVSRLELANRSSDTIVFSPGGELLATASSWSLPDQKGDVCIYQVSTGRLRRCVADGLSGNASFAFSSDSSVLAVSNRDEIRFWNTDSGDLLGTLTSFPNGDWLALMPNGLFDGSPRAWPRVSWRGSDPTADASPVEQYFSEYYRPGLLAEIVAGKRLEAPRLVSTIDRRQPEIKVTAPGNTASRRVTVHLEIRDTGSGIQDVRLFRDGLLVKSWKGEQKPNAEGTVVLETEVPVVAGRNRLSAYCFNRENVKSLDAETMVQGLDDLKRKGTAWILAVGINQYENPDFRLNYAVADARLFGSQLLGNQTQLGTFEQVEVIELTDELATRQNILAALAKLGGQTGAAGPDALSRLRVSQPEDAVFVYFAGHGVADGDRFYLVPHDLGYSGRRESLDTVSMKQITAHSISDLDLERAFEPVDARHIVLVIDACQSGQALASDETRRGPMNSRGLAQLAYEKGMYVLTAAQSYQAALEVSRFEHGLLTYALVEEGLKLFNADLLPHDGKIEAHEWLDFASARVPQLQAEAIQHATELGRALTFDIAPEPSKPAGLQTPRAFARRELSVENLLIAIRP